MKTVNLETAKQLKESGFPQFEIYFAWAKVAERTPGTDVSGWNHVYKVVKNDFQAAIEFIAAPTTEEIGNILQKANSDDFINAYFEVMFLDKKDYQFTNYHVGLMMINMMCDPDIAGKMYVYLRKEGLI